MKNSLSLEYALHSLVFLSLVPRGKTLTIKQLAHLLGVTPTYLAKVFTQLTKASLVNSTVGSKGGVHLARPAEEISFYDVFLAINGRSHMFQCAGIRTKGKGYVPVPGMCEVHMTMWEAEEKMYEHLRGKTVAEMADVAIKRFQIEDEEVRLKAIEQLLGSPL
ncbi:RrF2 family transcriptional regulator [Brevibacillus dissolubilis]|uniref:RrF2 family transcriptional regulator n=1 Tax=Brevibacillus dissolubilis TaxID=1844116 RepID=UPI0011164786|nr:Rrf2 family transcriptional regulator [Brevibacillus dissolubilis]